MQHEKLLNRDSSALENRHPLIAPVVLAALLIGVAVPIYNKGVLLGADVLLLLIAPVILPTIVRSRFLKLLWAFAILWSASQVISDVVHGTQLFSAPTVMGPLIALLASGFFWVNDNFRIGIPEILLAVGMGWIGLELVAGQAMASNNPWKYGMATPIVVTVLAFAYARLFTTKTIVALLLILAGISFWFDSRFETGLLIACAAALIVVGKRTVIDRRGWWRLGLLAVAILAMYLVYPSVAISGVLGDRAYAQQVLYNSEGANFLLATRLEFPQMLYLVLQDPWLGIGSYAQLNAGDAFAALNFLNDHVVSLNPNALQYLLNPVEGYPGYNTHSAALGSVLFAGILALPFWIFLLWSVLRSARRFTQGNSVAPALLIYMSGLAVWDTFFSPLSTRSHVSLAVTLFLVGANLALSRSDQGHTEIIPGRLG